MKKIENWQELHDTTDEVVAFDNVLDEFEPKPYICKILKVEDVIEKEYLKIAFDIADGEQKGLFKKAFDTDNREDKKWPYVGIGYRSYKESAKRFFASFITAVEKSNPGFKFDFDEQKLVGKLFVANFRIEEYLSDDYDDEGDQIIKSSIKCAEYRSIPALKEGNVKVLAPKLLEEKAGTTHDPLYHESQVNTTATVELPVDDDLPF